MSEPQGKQAQAKEHERSAVEMADRGVPLLLIKATSQALTYALGLWDGTVFTFTEANIHGPWATLKGVRSHSVPPLKRGKERSDAYCVFDKVVEVRIDSIIWVTDSPWGN
jgi:hypothetical protein